MEDILENLVRKTGPDVKDRSGKTVLRAAVDADWLPGVRVALRAGADVTLKAPDGETSLHAAAKGITCHNKEVRETMLHDLLTDAKQKDVVDCLNATGETALFHAVRSGYLSFVRKFLDNDAKTKHTTEKNLSVFHVAAKNGHEDILKTLLDFDENITNAMINSLTTPDLQGFAPIHFAVAMDNLECVRVLINKKANVCVKTTNYKYSHGSTTPLHIAIDNDNYDIAELILSDSIKPSFETKSKISVKKEMNILIGTEDKSENISIDQFDDKGWLPLHSAIHKGSENFIELLLKYNASLAAQTQNDKRKTALDMIMKHVTNPTDFLENVLNSYIFFSNRILNKATVDYAILMPSRGLKKEMDVIEALLKTGNEFNQKKLLLHPLIESFIYLKWWALRPYYFLIVAIYLIFLISLATFATSVYYYKDTNRKTEQSYSLAWGCVIIILIVLIILQELLMNVEGSRYFLKPENWVKLGSLGLAIVVFPAMMVQEWDKSEWPRHVATVALLLACMQMLNILSQFPKWGYYVVMFNKVAFNVIKILATFAVLIIGFALSFMIQFRSQIPFDGLWHAVVKTLFLLTAEFEYNNVFEANNAETLGSSFEAARVLFIAFLFLAAIVLMNMMVGVAVDEITDLKSHGNCGKLEGQAAFVRSLDTLKYNLTRVILPEKYSRSLFSRIVIIEKKTVKIKMFGSHVSAHIREILAQNRELPKRFQDALFSIAHKNKEKDHTKKIKEKEAAEEKNKFEKHLQFHERAATRLDELELVATDNASRIEDVNRKLDLLRTDLLEIKTFLMSLKENQGN
ncbi:hypothetical protein ABMA28_009186 [Loxostege sticticalis]|uniref:Ion transport domain-containing protein n=1 Tax=Loxostege sticticalis TaxID=481309 RepID=A0ABD0SCJ8_LOXSC